MGIEIALYHHEKWDGSGYPDGLIGRNIPLSARIMAIADVYDALRSDRCYRKGLTHEVVRSMILESDGTHFDPELVQAFLQIEDTLARKK
jgi:putative two-component system response regulator